MAITYRNERFSGYNKPKRTPSHAKKSHAVLAKKSDGSIKLVRFGQQGKTGAGPQKIILRKTFGTKPRWTEGQALGLVLVCQSEVVIT